MDKIYLTPQELADYLKINRNTVYRYIKMGRFTKVKIGSQTRIPESSVQKFIDSGSK